jgi:hypothetical protein
VSEIAGLCIIGALLAFICWLEWHHMRERRTLINTIISRTPGEARMLNQDLDQARFRLPEPRETSKVGAGDFWGNDDIAGFEGPVGL